METPLVILYTYGIGGDLDLLPRLYTFLRTLRAEHTSRVLLLDAGDSCDPDVWHCDVTGGRSTLIVLDAMGYDAANVEGILDDESRAKLVEQVRVELVDAAHIWRDEDLLVTNTASDEASALQIVLSVGETTRFDNGTLYLKQIAKGQVGIVHWDAALITSDVLAMPPDTQSDGTIAGAVDFVVGEARYYARKRQPKNGAISE